MRTNHWILSIFVLILLTPGCNWKETASRKLQKDPYFTCSMHPQILADKPGNCPICGMDLIEVRQTKLKDSLISDADLSYAIQPVTQTVIGTFKTITPMKKNLIKHIEANGTIDFDERDLHILSARVTGRIDQLYVKYSGQRIRKGQPLMKIYSPQLLTAQRDLLQAIAQNDTALVNPLKKHLIHLGMGISGIQKVIAEKKPASRVTLHSPYQGISRPISNPSGNGLLPDIKKGMYIKPGQAIFAIQGIRRRWALLYIPAADFADIHLGDPVQLYRDANPKKTIKGRINFIPPFRAKGKKHTAVRVYLNHSPKNWKIGSLIHASISTSTNKRPNAIYVPVYAVNRLGTNDVVWIQNQQHPHVFHARSVRTGTRTDDSIEILSGIGPGDQIVENTSYMVDSDSFIH